MAGNLGASFSKRSIAIFSLFEPQNSSIHPSQIPNSTTPFRQYCSSLKKTHQTPPEVKEHFPKVQKTHHNGAYVETPISLPLFKVKKLSENAVLPSRASALSAGYDLSSATESKVPARGKALVLTDLSIAIPEGTYARVGAFIGQHIVRKLILLLGRASVIVFTLSLTIFISVISLGGVGIANMAGKLKHKEFIGLEILCHQYY